MGGVATALTLASFAVPAQAYEADEATALQALRNFAICAVKRTPEGAAALLEMDPSSKQYATALARYAKGHGYCNTRGGKLQFNGLPFAGALAEALIAQRYEARSLAAAAVVEPAPETKGWAEALGACVARQRPEAVAALIRTEPASEEELAALKPTGDILPGCIAAGQTVKFNRPAVRAIYALGAYRLLAGTQSNPKG